MAQVIGAEIKAGDRVIRRRGRRIVGVVEAVGHPWTFFGQDATRTVARVRWEKSFARFHGGYGDTHSSIDVKALCLATDDVIAARKERARQMTPAMTKAVALWRERVGHDWARPWEVFSYDVERRHWRAIDRVIYRRDLGLFARRQDSDGRYDGYVRLVEQSDS